MMLNTCEQYNSYLSPLKRAVDIFPEGGLSGIILDYLADESYYKMRLSNSRPNDPNGIIYIPKKVADEFFRFHETIKEFSLSEDGDENEKLVIENDIIIIPSVTKEPFSTMAELKALHHISAFIESGIRNIMGFPCFAAEPKFNDGYSVKPEMKSFILMIHGPTFRETVDILDNLSKLAKLFSFWSLSNACDLRIKNLMS
jgi:hypothetical protein